MRGLGAPPISFPFALVTRLDNHKLNTLRPASPKLPWFSKMHNMLVRFRRHLPRGWGGPKLSTQDSCTLKIPRELIFCILEWLPPESVIAFALTCRTFFNQYFPRPVQLTLDEAKRLRELLAHDIPKPHLCYDCGHLHRWRILRITPKGQIRARGPPCRSEDLPSTWMNGTIAEVLGNNLTFSLFQLVMKRHFYGRRHGSPVWEIAVTKEKFSHTYYGVRIERSWNARVIDDSLYLHGHLVLRSSSLRHERELGDFVNNHSKDLVCPHISANSMGLWAIPERPSMTRWTQSFIFSGQPTPPESETKVYSCCVCFTDYRVMIKVLEVSRYVRALVPRKELHDHKWVIEVNRWHRLGECRSPMDPEWYNLIKTPGVVQIITTRRKYVCPAGEIRGKWLGRDGECDEDLMEGVFYGEG